ncbi:hypothetical protein RZS08_33310, partial [Arthrospira platensis SPKY1]|nr:hypothetical protein [Arthrospira platensis SPKY1]
MGSDTFRHLHTWVEWEKILTLVHLLVVKRPGEKLEHPLINHQAYTQISHQEVNCSSTQLRQDLQHGWAIDELQSPIAGLHTEVQAYIRTHRLYCP